MVATDACRCATCDSSAMVTRSRNVRWTRVLTVRSTQVAAVDTARPTAAACTRPVRCSSTPLPSSINHKARSASGSAASCESTSDVTISRGSCRYPSLHNRHMDDNAGGSGSIARSRLREDVIRRALLIAWCRESLCLQVEHRSIASAERDQLVVRAQLHHAAVLQHADTIRMAHGREAMRDEDGRALPGRGEQTVEYLGFPSHVELGGGLVEQHDARAQPDRGQRTGK